MTQCYVFVCVCVLQLPQWLGEGVQLPCKFWAVRLQNGLDQRIMEHVIITPAIDLLDEERQSQVHTILVRRVLHSSLSLSSS